MTTTQTVTATARELRSYLAGAKPRLSKAQLSQVINFSRITLIVGLVFLHYESYPNSRISPFRGMDTEAFQVATFVNSFVLFFFFSVVPLLSMVSGWLFFSFTDKPASELLSRMGKRFKSLYIPLILWNLLYLAILWAVFTMNSASPILEDINLDFTAAGPLDYFNAVFGVTHHPVGFQFWFVRDLFVTVLVSPVLWLFLTRAPIVGAVALGLVWLVGFDLWIFFRTDVVFFFYLGGLIRMRKVPLEISGRVAIGLLAAYILLVAVRTAAPYFINPGSTYVEVATRAMRLIGVLACWGVFQNIALSPFGATVARFGGFAFFLHAAHFPLLAAVKILLWDYVPVENQFWMLVHYAVSVIVTVAIGVGFGVALARLAPQQFAFLNGGRLAVT
jgi:surface polysaccharide O-acyltransferase-like enzyme